MPEKLKIASVGQGYPIVLLHGWGLNSGIWQAVIEKLAKQFEVISIDLPGYGDNKNYSLATYSIENVAAAITEAVDKPAVYVGWSLGGLIASQIALSHTEQLLALITVASSPQFVEQDNWPGIKPQVLNQFHQQLEEDTEKTINNFLKIQAMGSPHIRSDIKMIRELVFQRAMAEKNTLESSLLLLETVDFRNDLDSIRKPFLRLYGRLDSLVPKQVINEINTLSHNSKYYIFEQSSHAPFISEQQAFVAYLSSWVNQSLVPD